MKDVDAMHLSNILSRLETMIIIFCLISSIFFVYGASAEDAPDSRVDANFDIEFESATDLKITVTMDVSEITAFETKYYSADIQTLASSTDYGDIETMGGIKQTLHNLLKNQIELSFENTAVTPLSNRPTYKNNIFEEEYTVNLTYSFFNMDETVDIHNFINGVLDIGAIVAYVFNFQAEYGWNNTYAIVLTDSMTFHNTTGSVSGNRIRWEVDNWNGGNSIGQGLLSVQYVAPTTPKLESEDIALKFELDASNVNQNALNAKIIARGIDINNYGILPSFITNLNVLPSDGVRLFIDNSLLSWNDVYQNTLKHIENLIVQKIESSSFNQTLDMIFNWNPETTSNCSYPYNITMMDNNPSIISELLDDDINLKILDISAKALFGLINAGATANITERNINFGDKLNEIGYSYDGSLYMPNNISLDGENTYDWNYSSPISGEFVSDISPRYSEGEIEMRVDIEITKMDLNLLSFFTGTELTASLYAKEDLDIYVTTIPNEFRLPEEIYLDYLNSDVFRLCIEEEVFGEEDITNFLTNKKQLFEQRSSNILDNLTINGHVDRDAFLSSLNWDGDVSNMDGVVPITVSSYANFLYSIPFSLSFLPPGFDISDQEFNLKGLKNRDITYRILFPKGLEIEANDVQDKSITYGETEDGNKYIEITFAANESQDIDVVTCKISASTLYVLGLFLPCIISFVLVLILIVIIFILRKKRGKGFFIRKKKEIPVSEGYEGEDFYVPPPPQSK